MAKMTVELADPITIGDEVITEVIVRTPKVKEVRKIEALSKGGAADLDSAIQVALMLTNLTPEQVEELDTGDLFNISNKIADFFGGGGHLAGSSASPGSGEA